jgi:all-trans-retinol 13,14-reductase
MTGAYDAITIGSGLGGLTAAALYARAGHRVLVLERNAEFGGAATTYRHGRLTIEGSLHETADLSAPLDPKARILRALGILDDLEFVSVGAFLRGTRSVVRSAVRATARFRRRRGGAG